MTPTIQILNNPANILPASIMDLPSSIFVLLVILIIAFLGALFVGAIYKIINFFFQN